MRDARQVLWGIITALISITLLVGVFSLSKAEGNLRVPTSTLPTTITPPSTITKSPTITFTITWKSSPSLVVSPSPSWTPTLPPTSTLPPTPTNCPPLAGWLPYIIQPGDTLDGLALRYKITNAEISQANCLGTAGLLPAAVIYLPPIPTQTPVSCGAPATWVVYIVQPGDTLYHLGQAYGIPYTDIQRANCLTSTTLRTGQRLYVPPWATRTPSPTFPGIPTPTSILPSDTPLGSWTDTPTDTAIGDTSTPVDTDTPIPSDTAAATP